MKINRIPPPPVKPSFECVLNATEAKLVADILGMFTSEQLAVHMHMNKRTPAFKQFDDDVDTLYNEISNAMDEIR